MSTDFLGIFQLIESEDMRNFLRELSKKELVNCYTKCIELTLNDEFEDSIIEREKLRERTEESLISQILLSMGFFIKIYPDTSEKIFHILLSEETLSYKFPD